MESNPVKTKRENNKRIYEVTDKEGGIWSLIIRTPPSKLAQRIRDVLFTKAVKK